MGGGPAALMVAAFLDLSKFKVTIYEKNKAVGRKFLVAGKGGFNLSYADTVEELINKYDKPSLLAKALKRFNNQDLRNWLYKIGINTYVGTSNRIFPERGIKPIEVLNAIVNHIKDKQVEIMLEHHWNGWTKDGSLQFDKDRIIKADIVIFAMGGASWKITGSDGSWKEVFESNNILCREFEASNCAYEIDWPKELIQKHEGAPLKNIALSMKGRSIKGELVITRFGLEGAPIYAFSPEIRTALKSEGKVEIGLDLKPQLEEEKLVEKISNKDGKKITEVLKKYLKLKTAQIDLIKSQTDRETFTDPSLLAEKIKNINLTLVGIAPIDEAISTVGGIATSELSKNFELTKMQDHYCIGEMIDYDAPTGGYLLQSCFSMGVYLANYLNEHS